MKKECREVEQVAVASHMPFPEQMHFVTVDEAVNNVVLCAEIEKYMPGSSPFLQKFSDF